MGIVAFVDLLGFSADVESSWSEGDDSPLSRLMRIKEAANRIPEQGIFCYFPGGTPPFDPRVHGARVHTISDSIVICSALPPSGKLNDLTIAMTTVLQGVQTAWLAAIREGYTIRGALELGEIFWSKEETVGPALVRAYQLENKIAKTSRVILGPLFLKNLLDRMNDDWSAWPSSEWLSVSDDELIELSPHNLKDDRTLDGLVALQKKAGKRANKYDHILKTLKDGFQKASPAQITYGMGRTMALIRESHPDLLA